MRRDGQEVTQFRQDRMFNADEKKIYKELDEVDIVQVLCQVLKRVGGFGAISGESKRSIIERPKDLNNDNNGKHLQEMARVRIENVQK